MRSELHLTRVMVKYLEQFMVPTNLSRQVWSKRVLWQTWAVLCPEVIIKDSELWPLPSHYRIHVVFTQGYVVTKWTWKFRVITPRMSGNLRINALSMSVICHHHPCMSSMDEVSPFMDDIHQWHFHPWMWFLHPWMTSADGTFIHYGLVIHHILLK